MYLHIGLDIMIDARKIIGIFDIKTFKSDFLKNIAKTNSSFKESYSSYIITDEEIFFSEISSITLKRRFDNIFSVE